MTTTRLEHLPIELWLFIFCYFDLLEIVHSFSFLNRTIDSLIRSHHAAFQFRIHDGADFKRLIERSVTSFFNIVSLRVEKRLHRDHVLQLSRVLYQQPRLSHAHFEYVPASSICLCLTSLSHQLTSLTIHRAMSVDLLNQICCLPHLQTLAINFSGGIEGRLPSCLPPNITRLILGGNIGCLQLNSLLVIIPHIHSLTMIIRQSRLNVIGRLLPLLRNLTLHLDQASFRVIQQLRAICPVDLNNMTIKGNGFFEMTQDIDSFLWQKLLIGITTVRIDLRMTCYIESDLEHYVLDEEDIYQLRMTVEREEQKFGQLGISLVYLDAWDEPNNICILKAGKMKA